MTWLTATAALLAGGREDRCAIHKTHRMLTVEASLDHELHDWPTARLGWEQPVFVGEPSEGYCTADQDVSRSIVLHGCWEAFGSLLAAQILACDRAVVVDVGSNVGWYTNLAGAFAHDVLAIDADEANIAAVEMGWWANDWQGGLATCRGWIGHQSPQVEPHPIRLMKIDIEGLEEQALAVFARCLPTTDFVLAEVSPVLGSVEWVEQLCSLGFRGYRVPEKGYDVRFFEADPLAATIDWGPLDQHDIDHQADALFVREGVLG